MCRWYRVPMLPPALRFAQEKELSESIPGLADRPAANNSRGSVLPLLVTPQIVSQWQVLWDASDLFEQRPHTSRPDIAATSRCASAAPEPARYTQRRHRRERHPSTAIGACAKTWTQVLQPQRANRSPAG